MNHWISQIITHESQDQSDK